MTARDNILADAKLVLGDTDEFAEDMTYHPHQDFGQSAPSDRAITGIVIRNEISNYDADDEQLKVFEVYVANTTDGGISSEEINLGGDQLSFPDRDGKSIVRRTIHDITSQDHAGLVLLCR